MICLGSELILMSKGTSNDLLESDVEGDLRAMSNDMLKSNLRAMLNNVGSVFIRERESHECAEQKRHVNTWVL